jgi:hypothetical protein
LFGKACHSPILPQGYGKQEAAARADGLGIWAHECQPAWEWRAQRKDAVRIKNAPLNADPSLSPTLAHQAQKKRPTSGELWRAALRLRASGEMLLTADDVKRWLYGSAADAIEMQKPAPDEAIVVLPSEKKAA